MAATFDTHKAVRRLRDGGLEEAAAGAVVTTIQEAVDTLVTREVLQIELATLRTEMADLRADLRTEMADLRAGLYRALWIQGAGIVAIVGVLIAIA